MIKIVSRILVVLLTTLFWICPSALQADDNYDSQLLQMDATNSELQDSIRGAMNTLKKVEKNKDANFKQVILACLEGTNTISEILKAEINLYQIQVNSSLPIFPATKELNNLKITKQSLKETMKKVDCPK